MRSVYFLKGLGLFVVSGIVILLSFQNCSDNKFSSSSGSASNEQNTLDMPETCSSDQENTHWYTESSIVEVGERVACQDNETGEKYQNLSVMVYHECKKDDSGVLVHSLDSSKDKMSPIEGSFTGECLASSVAPILPTDPTDVFSCENTWSVSSSMFAYFPTNLANALCLSQSYTGTIIRKYDDNSTHRLTILADFAGSLTYNSQNNSAATKSNEIKFYSDLSFMEAFASGNDFQIHLNGDVGKVAVLSDVAVREQLTFVLSDGSKIEGLDGLKGHMSSLGKLYQFNTISTGTPSSSNSMTFPGTTGNDVISGFSLSQFKPGWTNNSSFLINVTLRGLGGDDTYYFPLGTLSHILGRTTVVSDSEGQDVIRLIGLEKANAQITCAVSSSSKAVQIDFSGGNKLQILKAEHFKFKLEYNSGLLTFNEFLNSKGVACQ